MRRNSPVFEQELAIALGKAAGIETAIFQPQRARHLERRQVVSRGLGFIQCHLDGAPPAADQGHDGNVGHLLHRVVDLGGDAAQLETTVAAAGKRQRQDGHVVDRPRFHQRLQSARGDQIEIGVELLVEPHDASFFVLSHVEAHDGQGASGARSRVDVLHAGDLPQQFFHGLSDALFDFAHGSAGHLHHHVDHRDDDLRLLLARQLPDGESANQQRRADYQRRELGGDPDMRKASRGTQLLHGPTSKRVPSASVAGDLTMVSPAFSPERTSTASWKRCPVVMSRVRATPFSTTSTDCNCPRSCNAAAGIASAGRASCENAAVPKSPERISGRGGRSILTVYAREAAQHESHVGCARPHLRRRLASRSCAFT